MAALEDPECDLRGVDCALDKQGQGVMVCVVVAVLKVSHSWAIIFPFNPFNTRHTDRFIHHTTEPPTVQAMLLLRRLRPLLVVLLLVFLVSPGALAHAAAAAAAVGDQPHRRHQEQQDIITFDAPGLGRVRGRRVRLPSGQVGAELLGLAYANRPVQRFKSATVWDTPSGQEEWDASSPRPPCPQMVDGEVVGSEDCLFLNIFLPPAAIAAAANASSPSLPVYVFAHGGSFILGSPSSPGIDGAAFAADRSVVVVTLAYRLGALGFLAHPAMNPEVMSGGVMSVKTHTSSSFGRITIFQHVHHREHRGTLGCWTCGWGWNGCSATSATSAATRAASRSAGKARGPTLPAFCWPCLKQGRNPFTL